MSELSGKIYRHFKGSLYQVIDTCHSTETEEVFVVYRSLNPYPSVWCRPYKEFFSDVPESSSEFNVTHQTKRFEEVTNLNNPLTSIGTRALILELQRRSDRFDYDSYGNTKNNYTEYVFGNEMPVTEENPLGIYITNITDDLKQLKRDLGVNHTVYKRVYLPVNVADLLKDVE